MPNQSAGPPQGLICPIYWEKQTEAQPRDFFTFNYTKSLCYQLVEWCPGAELNHRHADFQSIILPCFSIAYSSEPVKPRTKNQYFTSVLSNRLLAALALCGSTHSLTRFLNKIPQKNRADFVRRCERLTKWGHSKTSGDAQERSRGLIKPSMRRHNEKGAPMKRARKSCLTDGKMTVALGSYWLPRDAIKVKL